MMNVSRLFRQTRSDLESDDTFKGSLGGIEGGAFHYVLRCDISGWTVGRLKINMVDELVAMLSLTHELCDDHATSQSKPQRGVPYIDTCNYTAFCCERCPTDLTEVTWSFCLNKEHRGLTTASNVKMGFAIT